MGQFVSVPVDLARMKIIGIPNVVGIDSYTEDSLFVMHPISLFLTAFFLNLFPSSFPLSIFAVLILASQTLHISCAVRHGLHMFLLLCVFST